MPRPSSWLGRLLTFASLVAIAAVAAFPFLVGEGVPRTNDLVPHLHRAFALKQMVEWGYLWPRWAAGLVHGYGYPVFNFFPLLSHWLIVLWHLLGFPLLTAYKLTVFTHYLVTAATSFALGRALTGRFLGGWLVALIYTLSPYLLYDAIVRGSPPESQALALLPLLVLGLWQLQTGSSNLYKWVAITTATYAAMILSHHPVTLQVSFMIGLWIVAKVGLDLFKGGREKGEGRRKGSLIKGSREGGRKNSFMLPQQPHTNKSPRLPAPFSLFPVPFSLLLGALLTAFFALPALLEIDLTRATLSISQGYTYADNFLPLGELFRWPMLPADPARLNPPVVRPLPLMGLGLAMISLIFSWRRVWQQHQWLLVIWGLTGIVGTWLITPASAVAWRVVPLLEFTLYPWRMLGWISLMVALIAGVTAAAIENKKVYWWIGILGTVLVTAEAVPWLFPPREPMPAVITQAIVSGNELPPFLIGTTTLGEFLPAGVETLPDTQPLKEALITEGNPERLQPADGLSWTRIDADPLDLQYELTAATDQTVVLRHFYFPGWRVEIDGQPQTIIPTAATGLIAFDLPQGTHHVRIWFGSTPIRTAGGWISATAAVSWLLVIGYWFLKREKGSGRRDQEGSPFPIPSSLSPLPFPLFLLATFTLLALVNTPLRRDTLRPDGVVGLPQITPLEFAGELRLLTFTQSAAHISADESVMLTTFWTPLRGIGVDYAFGVQVVDGNGLPWQAEINRPLDWRFVGGSEIWPADTYRLEPFEITLLDGTPPGDYTFLMGLVRKDSGQTVASHTFGQLTVVEPSTGDRPLEPGMIPVNDTLAGSELLGIKPDRTDARPGDPLRLALLWRRDNPDPLDFSVQLIDEGGEPAWTSDLLSLPAGQAGDRLRVDQVFRLPAALPSGAYRWHIIAGQAMAATGTLTITAPDRIFDPPPVDQPLDLQFGDLARLHGLPPSSLSPSPFSLTLVWQATAETTTSYRVFVHLVDESGHILAQSDGEPAGWSRPTTGWLPPEFIVDEHVLNLPDPRPEGRLTLRIGLYNPENGERVITENGDEFFEMVLSP